MLWLHSQTPPALQRQPFLTSSLPPPGLPGSWHCWSWGCWFVKGSLPFQIASQEARNCNLQSAWFLFPKVIVCLCMCHNRTRGSPCSEPRAAAPGAVPCLGWGCSTPVSLTFPSLRSRNVPQASPVGGQEHWAFQLGSRGWLAGVTGVTFMISGSNGKTFSRESYLQPVDEPQRTDSLSFPEYCLDLKTSVS